MNGSSDSNCDWPGFISGVNAVWEWVQQVVAALWGGLGWPHSVLIMFCIGVYYFRGEIKNILPRIKKIGTDGFEVEAQVPPVQPSTKSGDFKSMPGGDFPHTFELALELVKKEVDGKSDAESLQYLLVNDAGWRVLCYFEGIYSYIYGGQIKLLQLLNARALVGLTMVEVEREWDEHKARFKPTMDDWELQPYLNFLVAKDLIVRVEEKIQITFTGNEFLTWMTKYQRSTERLW